MDEENDVVENEGKDSSADSTTDEQTNLDQEASGDGGDSDNNDESSNTNDSNDEASEEEVLEEGSDMSERTVPYKRFKEVNDKVNELKKDLAEAAKNSKDDAGEDSGDEMEKRIAAQLGPLSEELKRLKKRDTVSTLQKMMSEYPDFKKNWTKIKDLIPTFESAGYDYAKAVKTAYFSIVGEGLAEPSRNSEDGFVKPTASNKSNGDDDTTTKEEEEAYRLAGLSPERVKELKKKGKL